MPAGVDLVPKALGFGGQAPGTANQAADSEIDFEEIVIDADGNVVRKETPSPLSTVLVLHAVAFGPAAQSQLRTGGTARFATETAGFARRRRSASRSRASTTSRRSRWTARRRTSSRTRPSRRRSSGTCRRTRSDRGQLQVVAGVPGRRSRA